MTHEETTIVEWNTPEFTYTEKKTDWYWALGVIVLVGFILAIVSKNFLLGLLVALAGGLLFFFARKKPTNVFVEVSELGVKIDSSLYPYNNIESFWLGTNTHDEPILFLHVKRTFLPLVIVPIHPGLNLEDLRGVFLEFLPEVEHSEPLAHQVSDRLGF